MASTWGARNGLPGYDRFRTHLTFREVKRMMFDNHEDRSRWKYKRRRTVLGAWHDLKLQLYWQMRDAEEGAARERAA